MIDKLREFIRRYRLISPGDEIVCAVSGGADSMAMLWALYLLQGKLEISVSAAHFNHRLRGKESDSDEAFVRHFCGKHEIALHVGAASRIVPDGRGLEAAAREARYAFLLSLPGKIATAHTADDNAETILMHLVRGTGLRGLGGIAPENGRIIRPMLSITRTDIEKFLGEYHIPHREDSTNSTDEFLRNRIRRRVIPLLKAENPRLAEDLSATALRLREDERVLSELAGKEPSRSVSALRDMPSAVRTRVLANILRGSGVAEPTAAHIAQAEALVLSDNPSARASFPGGVCISRRYDTLESLPPEAAPAISYARTSARAIVNTADIFTVVPCGEIFVRARLPGDCIRLPGGTKSLKKLFIDRKIPAALRGQVPVICDEAGILGIPGIGVNLNRAARSLPAEQLHFFPSLPAKRCQFLQKQMGGDSMLSEIKEVLLSEEQIQTRVRELAEQLSEEYAGKDPVFVGVLKGVVVFYADFIKNFTQPCQMDFMWISSYQGSDSTGKMTVRQDVSADLKGRHVVILEDIFDTGLSLEYTYRHLLSKQPASLKICTLLDKPGRRAAGITVKPEYTGFVIPNEFVVGYGLDYNEHYRNLPYVGILRPEAYEK